MKDILLNDWDRETTLAFLSMIAGAVTWVLFEKILLGFGAGIVAFAILSSLYQAVASVYGLRNLSFVDEYEIPLPKNLLNLRSRRILDASRNIAI